MKKWILGIVVCLVIGTVVLILVMANTRARQDEYAAAVRQKQAAEERAEQAANTVAQLERKAVKIAAHRNRVDDAMVQARHAVTFVLGARKPKPTATPTAAKPSRQPRRKTAPELAGGGSAEVPAGIMTREMLDRMRGKKPPKKAAPDPDDVAEVAAPSEPESPPPPPPPKARTVVFVAKKFTEVAELGQALLRRPPELVERAKALQDSILRASTPEKAEARMLEMSSLEVSMDECAHDMEVTLPRLATLSAELDVFAMAAAKARNSVERDVLHRAQEAERQRLIAADMSRLEALRSANRALLNEHAYETLAALIEARVPDCRSDAGRKAYAVAVARYRKLDWLKSYIIEQIQSAPLRWGWGLGTVTLDVERADKKGVQVKGKLVRWSSVSTAQFVKWGNYYAAQSPLPGRTAGALQLALAVFYSEHGSDERASELRTNAIMDWEQLKEEAMQLLPDL